MQFYPRFLKREMVDEYLHSLAPPRDLFTEFKAKDRELKDHDKAFLAVAYESRFGINEKGILELARLSEISSGKDVFLLCQCLATEKCHGDLLLLLAKGWFAPPIQRIRPRYPEFERRIAEGGFPLPSSI